MVHDVNLIATLLLGWTAICHGKMMENTDEPKSVIKEYKAGNLNEKLTIDHVTYDNPRGATKKAKQSDREEGRSVTLNLNRDDDDDDDDDEDDSPPTTMLTEPSSLKPIGMRRPVSTSPEPTIPEDLLREVSLMKIPQYDLPKTITSIQTQPLKSFKDDFPSYENDDIMKPEYSKYFNDDYQVPVEYQKFNFKSQLPKDDTEKHVKIEIGKTRVKTVVDEPIIITKTKLIDYNTLEGSTTPDTYTSYYKGYHDHYRNVQKDKVRAGCYNCYGSRPLYSPPMYKPRLPYPPPPRPVHYPLGSPYVPRYAPRYARSRYVRPVYRPTVMRYPPPRHLHYRPPYRRPRPVYLPRPPRIHPPYWYPPPPPPPPPQPRVPPPKPSCPPSKVVKEVHVHHFPTPSKIEKIPVPVAILEANHDENYEHDSIIEPGPYDEEGLDSDEHAELQEINAHLDEALRNNKKELDKNLENGQRYIIEQEDKDREGTGSGSSEEDEFKKPNYNKIIDQALVKNRKELEKNLKDGPDIVKTAYLPDDGIYNLHKFADKNHLYNFPVKAKSKGQKTSSSSNANDYKLHLESLKDFEPRKILHDGTPIRYILTNKMSYNHTKPQEG